MSLKTSRFSGYFPLLSPVAGVGSAVLGVLALLGWALGLQWLASFGGDLIPMAPSTALLLIALGASLFLLTWFPWNRSVLRSVRVIVSVAAGASLLLLYLSMANIRPAVERLGFSSGLSSSGMPIGHISPISAVCLSIASLALLSVIGARSGSRNRHVTGVLLASTLLITAQLLVLAYVFGAPLGLGPEFIVPALPTSLGLLLLGLGSLVLAARGAWPDFNVAGVSSRGRSYNHILVFAILATCILTIGYLYFREFGAKYRTGVEHQLAAVADLKVNDLVQYRRERLGDASLLFNNRDISRLVERHFSHPRDSGTTQLILTWLHKFKVGYSYNRVMLLDTNGVLRLSATAPQERVDSIIVHEGRELFRKRGVHFEDFYRSDVDQKVYLAILVPLYTDTKPLGFMTLRIDPDIHLYPYVRNWPSPSKTSETLLIRREGTDAVYLNTLRFSNAQPLTLRIPLTRTIVPAVRAVLGFEGMVDGIDYSGRPALAHVRHVPGSPWFLVARTPVEETVGPVRERLWLTLILVAALISGAGFVLANIWRAQRTQFFRQRYEQAELLRQADERFRTLVEVAPDGIFLTDGSGTFTDVNPSACDMLGHAKEDLLARKVADFIVTDDPAAWDLFRARLHDRGTIVADQVLVRRDGALLPVEISARLLPHGGFQGIFRDITERKRAEDLRQNINEALEARVHERTVQLEIANKELEAFSYSVSHDLRAPLRGIDGWSLALLEDYGGTLDERAQLYLGRVRTETQRMGHLIDDLIRLSRVTRAEMRRDRIDLSALVRTLVAYNRSSAPARQIECTIEDELLVNGDPPLLEAALSNLIENAFKFTGMCPVAHIAFGSTRSGDERVFFVRDNGAGFDMTYAKNLFAPFQRMHSMSEFPGTGIGLAIVQRIIHRHGGRIWAESEVNHGTTFYFTLENPV
jgi:PAS domain S-box-containing protein